LTLCREIAVVVARTFSEPPNLVLLLEPRGVPVTSSGKLT
jgi:hypothetical protein